MARVGEKRLLDRLEDVEEEVHENNIMLRQIIKVINIYLSRHHQENEDDFGRNVLANLVSGYFNLSHHK